MYRTIRGLERCVITRLAYAIEYDCIDPTALRPSLGALDIAGLYFAGQINGTSGYEEAACQGLLAGMNAALKLQGKKQILLTRDMAYIGVLTDDLTTKGTDEPYRMMTSRAEYRLLLRQDNADLRLTETAHRLGLASDERMRRLEKKRKETEAILHYLREEGLEAELRKPDAHLTLPDSMAYGENARLEAEIQVKYEGYLAKEATQIARMHAMEDRLLPPDTPYESISALRLEARQKLAAQRPRSLGQASRIPGVSPADVSVLMIWLMRNPAL
jgi:tRNA uridine 5-carboxymethylaminomethyl modification enzyme